MSQEESSEERHARSGEFLLEQKERKAAQTCEPWKKQAGEGEKIGFPNLLHNPS